MQDQKIQGIACWQAWATVRAIGMVDHPLQGSHGRLGNGEPRVRRRSKLNGCKGASCRCQNKSGTWVCLEGSPGSGPTKGCLSTVRRCGSNTNSGGDGKQFGQHLFVRLKYTWKTSLEIYLRKLMFIKKLHGEIIIFSHMGEHYFK
jgi:hypothetical protein